MIDLSKNPIERPENIEDYVAQGIKDWSNEFLVERLSQFGIPEDEANALIKKVKEERGLSGRHSILEDVDDADGTGTVHGWLETVLILVLVGAAVSFFYPLIEHSSVVAKDNSFWGLVDSGIIDGLSFFVLGIYAVIQVYRRKPNGIFLLKSYLYICLISKILFLFDMCSGNADSYYSFYSVFIAVVWNVVFLIYIYCSTQVGQLFPKDKRRVRYYDWLIVGIYPLLFVIFFCYGVFQAIDSAPKDDMERYVAKVSTYPLSEHTDIAINYNREENTLYVNQTLPMENVYLNNSKYVLALMNMGQILSSSSQIIYAINSVNTYDSLIYYVDQVKADIDFKVLLPNGRTVLYKKIDYRSYDDLEDADQQRYLEDMFAFGINIANGICPTEVEEGLWANSILYNKSSRTVSRVYQISFDVSYLSNSDYIDLVGNLKDSVLDEYTISNGINLKFILLDYNGNIVLEKTYKNYELTK